MANDPILSLFSVSKLFHPSKILAIEDINLNVERSEFVCILGPNGCGKTTLLNLIAGFKPYFPPTEGRVSMNGEPITGPGSDRVMVFQEQTLFPWLSVRDNIEFGLKIRGTPKAERQRVSEHYLKLMELEEFKDKYPFQLSGGMNQKTELARALALKPEILLLDEPFAQVDAMTRLSLQEELLRVSEIERRTTIFVTHSIQEAIFLGDRVCVMTKRPGKIKEEVRVDFPKPRKWATVSNERKFAGLHNHLVSLIQEGELGNAIK